jgi:hypothetical protein
LFPSEEINHNHGENEQCSVYISYSKLGSGAQEIKITSLKINFISIDDQGRIMSLTKRSAEKIYIIAPPKLMTQDVGHICVKTS